MNQLGISIECSGLARAEIPNIETLLRSSGLSLPSLVTTIAYTARIRTEAILRREIYRVVSGFKKIMKKPVKPGEEDLRAIKEGMQRIKRETRKSLEFHLKDYQENLKFRYLFTLSETVAQRLSQAVSQQLQAYSADFAVLADRLSTKQGDKEHAAALLADMDVRCRRIGDVLGRLRQDISGFARRPS
jgi:hypothetical protein